MIKIRRLVPICIMYLNGIRLNTACDGAFRGIRVLDALGKVGQCIITFDFAELGKENRLEFADSYACELSVHLGYKDDTREVFRGIITATGVEHTRYGSKFLVTASSYLSLLEHGRRTRTFEHITPSQAIKRTLERYDLQVVDCEPFGPVIPYWQSQEKTDLRTITDIAKSYGRDIYCFGKNVYVKRLMTMHQDEHIYEWGKSLIELEVDESVKEQVCAVCVLGWNILESKPVRGMVKIADLEQKMGGRQVWTELMANKNDESVNQTYYVYDHMVKDIAQAKERADAILREKSFKYMRAEGVGEGNHRLATGSTVTLKYVSKACDGEYIAYAVIHNFNLEDGYTTKFGLKRNMANDDLKRKVRHVDMYADRYAKANATTAGSQKSDAYKEKYEEEDEDGPEFRSLKWKKGGKEIAEALVDDKISLYCDVKNIADGETVKFSIFEQGENKDDPIDEVEGEVKNGEVEVPWEVVYKGGEGSNCAEELEEQGWTLPDYYFVVEYGGVESDQGKVLEVKNIVHKRLVDSKTGESLSNTEYTVILTGDGILSGTTDADGYIEKIQLKHFVKITEIRIRGKNE